MMDITFINLLIHCIFASELCLVRGASDNPAWLILHDVSSDQFPSKKVDISLAVAAQIDRYCSEHGSDCYNDISTYWTGGKPAYWPAGLFQQNGHIRLDVKSQHNGLTQCRDVQNMTVSAAVKKSALVRECIIDLDCKDDDTKSDVYLSTQIIQKIIMEGKSHIEQDAGIRISVDEYCLPEDQEPMKRLFMHDRLTATITAILTTVIIIYIISKNNFIWRCVWILKYAYLKKTSVSIPKGNGSTDVKHNGHIPVLIPHEAGSRSMPSQDHDGQQHLQMKLLYREIMTVMPSYAWILGCTYAENLISVIIDDKTISKSEAKEQLSQNISESLYAFLDVTTEGCSLHIPEVETEHITSQDVSTKSLYLEITKLLPRYGWILGCTCSEKLVSVIIDKQMISKSDAMTILLKNITTSLCEFLKVTAEDCGVQTPSIVDTEYMTSHDYNEEQDFPTRSLYLEITKLLPRFGWILGCTYSEKLISVIIDEKILKIEAKKILLENISKSLHAFLEVTTEGCSVKQSCRKYGSGCRVNPAHAHQSPYVLSPKNETATVTLFGRDNQSQFAITVGHITELNQKCTIQCICNGTTSTGRCSSIINNTRPGHLQNFTKLLRDIALLRFDNENNPHATRIMPGDANTAIEIFQEKVEPIDDRFQPKTEVHIFTHPRDPCKAQITTIQTARVSKYAQETSIINLQSARDLDEGVSGSLVTFPTVDGRCVAFAYVVGFDVKEEIGNHSRLRAVPLWDPVKELFFEERGITFYD